MCSGMRRVLVVKGKDVRGASRKYGLNKWKEIEEICGLTDTFVVVVDYCSLVPMCR